MNRSPQLPIVHLNFAVIGALLIGLIGAVCLGTMIGKEETRPLLWILLVLIGIAYAIWLHRYVWQISLFLLYNGFVYRPTNFAFGPVEIGCALGVAVIAIYFWQRRSFQRPPLLDRAAFGWVERMLFVWLAYVALHMIFNIRVPYLPAEFKLTNALKSYFALSAPLLLFFYFSRAPAGIVAGTDFFWKIARLLAFGVILNLGLRIYDLAGGKPVFIPVVNATWSDYALRSLAPIAMLFAAVGLTGPGPERRSAIRFLTFAFLGIAGTAAAVLSGGRATIVYGFACICAVLLVRRRVIALLSMVAIAIVAVALANFSAEAINRSNPFVQRSLQWVLFKKNWETVGDLESSTSWRQELFRRSIAEWKSDPRIFWTGRATFGFGVADETAIVVAGGYQALIQTSIRRGATHNLLTDLLVAYGIIGCVVYLVLYLVIIRFYWKLHRTHRLSPPATNLVLTCFVGSIFALLLDITSGGNIPTDIVWFSLVLIASLYSGAGIAEDSVRSMAAPVHCLPVTAAQRRSHA